MIVFTKQTADEILTAFDNKEIEFEIAGKLVETRVKEQ